MKVVEDAKNIDGHCHFDKLLASLEDLQTKTGIAKLKFRVVKILFLYLEILELLILLLIISCSTTIC